jgi:hypothetical protein
MRYVSALAVAVSFGVGAPGAGAETLPAYDPLMICEAIAGSSARPEMIMRGCLDWQERTRKEIALLWNDVPEPVQHSCAAATKPSGDYWKLKSCIDKQAKSSPSE